MAMLLGPVASSHHHGDLGRARRCHGSHHLCTRLSGGPVVASGGEEGGVRGRVLQEEEGHSAH